jgi:putative DNA primase/helicase
MSACTTCGQDPCVNPSFCQTCSKGDKQQKPLLVIDSGDLPSVALNLRDILAGSGALYNRGAPARLTLTSSDATPVATPLTTHGVVRLAHEFSRPIKNNEPVTLPDRVANMYLDMAGEWKLPKLAAICTTPILRDDGTIVIGEGYDPTTAVYTFGIPTITIPECPTREQALTALQTLRNAFRTFPFGDAARQYDPALGVDVVDHREPIGIDETSFICALLTAICRPSLWLAPGLLLNAPAISGAGSGKGLLVRAIGMIAYGAQVRPFTPGNDRHEMDKRIVAEIMEARSLLFMDNLNSTLLRSNTLASLLTERPSGVRILGQSKMVQLEHASFIAVTGNGLTVSEDLARRFIYCELDALCEDPEGRPFTGEFIDFVRERRSALLAAGLTIWRWGRQNKLDKGVPLGSFERWGRWARDPLLALGCPDPVNRVRQLKERDPARQLVIELFAAWWEAHQDKPIRVADLAPEVRDIADPNQRGRQYLARAIENLVGTRQGGFTLGRAPGLPNKRKMGTLYRLLRVVAPSTVGTDESSASSAVSAVRGGNSGFTTTSGGGRGADGVRMPRVGGAEVPDLENTENTLENNDLDEAGTGNADDADDSEMATAEPTCVRCGVPGNDAFGALIACGRDGSAGFYHPRCWMDERTKGPLRPALGPPGDSLGDFE